MYIYTYVHIAVCVGFFCILSDVYLYSHIYVPIFIYV